jgi:hypothetical protein
MGWLLKTGAFLLGIMLFGAGAWELTLLIFAWLFVPPLMRLRRPKRASEAKGGPRGRFPLRDVLGGLLFLLAFAALLSHGTYSPLVFGALGALVMLWGKVPVAALGSRLRPVEGTILLRSSPVPLSWAAVAEVKLLTHDVGRAMAGVNGTVLVSASGTPSLYVVVEERATGERSAEEAVIAALRETALSLSPLGAYLLPLDSGQATELLQPALEASKVGEGDWSRALASGTYDVLTIRQEGGFARSLGVHRRADDGREGGGGVPPPSHQFAHPPFLMEVYKAVGNRLSWPQPDQRTAFLSSLLATSGEPIGTRISDGGGASQSQMVVVKSQGSPPVELSRPQLRAVVRLYDGGTQ